MTSAHVSTMRWVAPLFCLLLMTACDESTPSGPTVALDQRVTLAPGDVASIEKTDLKLQFVGVTGDSRCPADALCITGGDAVVEVRASGSGAVATLSLHTGDSSRASAAYGGLKVELVELQPYPFTSRPVAAADYRATLRATR